MLREYYKCGGVGHAMEKDRGHRDRPADVLPFVDLQVFPALC